MDNLEIAVNHAVSEYRLAQLRSASINPQGFGLDTKRNLAWCEYGFPQHITDDMLYRLYRRTGLAHGAVNKVVNTCWGTNPWIIEGEPDNESKTQTALEKSLLRVFTPRFWRGVTEADRRRLVTRYSGIILHIRDNEPWNKPVKRGKGLEKITPVWGTSSSLKPVSFETDESSPTYGNPTMWQYKEESRNGLPGRVVDIHPDRIFILGDWTGGSIGWLEPAYNSFVSMEKVEGGSGESFLKNASRQVSMNFDKDIDFNNIASMYGVSVESLQEKFNEAAVELNRGNDQILVTQGATVSPLVAAVADPEPTYNVNLQTVSAALDIPSKILVGMQTGERASTEDQRYFNSRCQSRRKELSFDIEELVDHLILIKVIEPISKFSVMWDNLSEQTPSDRLESASKMSQINQAALASGEAIFTSNEIRVAAGYEPDKVGSLGEDDDEDEEDDSDKTSDIPN